MNISLRDPDYDSVVALERGVWEAIRTRNLQALSEMSAPDYAAITASGSLEWSRVAASIEESQLDNYDLGEIQLRRISADVVALHFLAKVTLGSAEQARRVNAAVLSIWARRDGKWFSVLAHEIEYASAGA